MSAGTKGRLCARLLNYAVEELTNILLNFADSSGYFFVTLCQRNAFSDDAAE